MQRAAIILSSFLAISACALVPRGAGLQSEVLATTQDENPDAIQDFALEVVSKNTLATYANWPTSGVSGGDWINRVAGATSRTIRTGDTISVTVWSTENDGLLTTPGQRNVTFPDMQVSSAGTIFLPYVGKLRISGMTPDSARDKIEQAYSANIASPQVQLQLRTGRLGSVSLIGGVAAPGTYALPNNDFTILELFADGGGIRAGFVNPQVRLQRENRAYNISAERLLASARYNTTLRGGDKVLVQEDERTFLSLGAAGSEAVHPFTKDSMTALEALSIIGGISDSRADPKGILILRQYPGSQITADRSGPDHPRTIFMLDLTSADGLFSAGQFLIAPDDLIYVTESPLTTVNSIFGLFRSVISINNQL